MKPFIYITPILLIISGAAFFGSERLKDRGPSSVSPQETAVTGDVQSEGTVKQPDQRENGSSDNSAEGETNTGTTEDTGSSEASNNQTVTTITGSGRLDLTRLPLGNNKYSSSPQVGYIYSCQTSFNGGGAFNTGPWINETAGTYDVTGKVTVDGSNTWPNAFITISEDGGARFIQANGVPTNHGTGNFPVSSSDDAYDYDRNPNTVSEQSVSYALPINPEIASSASCVSMGAIGISLNGVVIFNGFDALARDAVAYEIQDACGGHPERSGAYHYHSGSSCFNDVVENREHSALFGYALDGFGVFGKISGGKYVNNSDLDVCHGHEHTIYWDNEETDMYHYHLTDEYPYTIGCFKGGSTNSAGGGGAQGSTETSGTTGGMPTPPQEAITACASKSVGSSCSFTAPQRTVSGTCVSTPGGLACAPAGGPPR